MTADEFTIRHLTKDLHHLYTLLEERKHTPEKPKEARTMRPAPGPRAPGNHLWIARGIDMEQRLREVSLNAFHDLQVKLRDDDGKVHNILRLITYHAQPIAALPWADDFQDELDRQVSVMGRWLNPPEPKDIATQPEKRQDATHIARRMKNRGITITTDQIRKWAERGHITREELPSGKAGYLLTDVIGYLHTREDKQ